MGCRMQKGTKKLRFSTNISLYIGNDTRYKHGYHGMQIGNRSQAFEWYHFQLPWVIWSDLSKYSVIRSTCGLSATAELLVII